VTIAIIVILHYYNSNHNLDRPTQDVDILRSGWRAKIAPGGLKPLTPYQPSRARPAMARGALLDLAPSNAEVEPGHWVEPADGFHGFLDEVVRHAR
jgi:hypothetical protein